MKHQVKLCLIVSTLFFSYQAVSQSDQPEQLTLASTKVLYRIIDTVSHDKQNKVLKVIWMDSLIEVAQNRDLTFDLESARKFRKEPNYIPSKKDSANYIAFFKNYQNCYSYTLQSYFMHHSVSDSLFNKTTCLVGYKDMRSILKTTFVQTKSIKVKSLKKIKQPFSNGSLLIFRNKFNWPIHCIFFSEKYYSKNGQGDLVVLDDLKPFFKTYWDTQSVEEYQLDIKKITAYLSAKAER